MLIPFKKLIPFEIVLSSHWCGQKFLSKQTSEHFSWKSKYILTPPYCSPCSTSARLSPYMNLIKSWDVFDWSRIELYCPVVMWIIQASSIMNYSNSINFFMLHPETFLSLSVRRWMRLSAWNRGSAGCMHLLVHLLAQPHQYLLLHLLVHILLQLLLLGWYLLMEQVCNNFDSFF